MLLHRLFKPGIVFMLLVFLLSACSPAVERAQVQPSVTLTASGTPTASPTVTRTPTATDRVVIRKPSATPTVTQTPTATLPVFQPAAIQAQHGTPLPFNNAAISAINLTRLTNVAQWGRGKVSAVGVSPDGELFVAGTPFGLAVYHLDQLDAGPRWIAFEQPKKYIRFTINDYQMLRIETQSGKDTIGTTLYNLSSGNPAPQGMFVTPDDLPWFQHDYKSLSVKTVDGTRIFNSSIGYMDDMMQETSTRTVSDGEGNQLYSLTDTLANVTYDEWTSPEGCDLEVFSPCGNALMPVAMGAYNAAFSSAGKSLAVLYRPPELGNSESFSILRTYQVSDGKLLQMIGSYADPVTDFAFIPGREEIMVAFANGVIQRWAIGRDRANFSSRAFNEQVYATEYTHDGKYLLVRRSGALEVRSSRDGQVIQSYPGSAFAISPTENKVAVGQPDGLIRIEELDQQETVLRLEGHSAMVYALAFSSDGSLLSSSAEDCRVRLWDAQSGKFLHYLEKAVVDPYGFKSSRIFVYSLQFIPGTDHLTGFGSWGTMVDWNVNSGAARYTIQSDALEYYRGMMTVKPHFPESFAIDADNQRFAIGDKLYSLTDGSELSSEAPEDTPAEPDCAQDGPVSADGKLRFTRGFNHAEGSICILDAQDGRVIQTMHISPEHSPDGLVGWPALSPNGRQLAVPIWGGQIWVFQVQ
jgi:WD40 repeat protein